MIEKVLKFILVGLVVVALVATALYFGFIYLMGHNFVHDEQARTSPEYSSIESAISIYY